MGNQFLSIDSLNHRIDHDTFEDVAKEHFKEGTIKDFGVKGTNPIELDGTCTVEVEGGNLTGVPIFYHCRKGWFDEKVGLLQGNHSLGHAAWGFRAGQKVVVAMRENQAVAVLGHNESPVYYQDDPKAPWPCLDIFRLQWHRTIGGSKPGGGTASGWDAWFGFLSDWYTIHYRASTQEEWKPFCEPPVGPDGSLVQLPHRARHIYGMKEIRWGTIVWYTGDWLIVVGPVAYIFQVYSVGMPAPMTGAIKVLAAIWTPEREAQWLEVGARKEGEAGGPGIWPHLMTDFPYPEMVEQSKFTKVIGDRFMGAVEGQWKPSWVVSEFWTYDWDRLPSVPGTPNTPAG